MAEIESVLISGANRGIGLEFIKQFLVGSLVKPKIVIATCRKPEEAAALKELQKSNQNLHVLKLDVSDFSRLPDFANEVKNIVGEKGLTLLINNAALGPGVKKLDEVTSEEMVKLLTTNVVAPLMLIKVILPLLKTAASVNPSKISGLSIRRAAAINISSFLGSVALNEAGAYWMYRESKAAVNMSTKSLNVEFEKDGILFEAIHPGHVRTDMGGPTGAIDVTESVSGMIKVLSGITESNKKGFPTWDGRILPF